LVHHRKSWRTNALFLIALWLILLIASLTILSSVVTPFLKTLQTQNLISLDWGGYGVSSNVLFPQAVVSSVGGSWTVPSVTITGSDTFSAAWIGIGGQTDSTLIQVGTEHDSIGGQAVYNLWYEMLPADSISIPNINVSPGDEIRASIILLNTSTNIWQISIQDVTNGKGFSQNFAYNSTRLTAEWIIERPTVNNQLSILANFGTVTFTNANAKLSSTTGTISTFPNYEILMENRQNTQLVTVSSLSRDGSSFTIGYA
jgi:hypothetical protein